MPQKPPLSRPALLRARGIPVDARWRIRSAHDRVPQHLVAQISTAAAQVPLALNRTASPATPARIRAEAQSATRAARARRSEPLSRSMAGMKYPVVVSPARRRSTWIPSGPGAARSARKDRPQHLTATPQGFECPISDRIRACPVRKSVNGARWRWEGRSYSGGAEALAQGALLDFGGAGLGQLGEEVHGAGALVVGELRAAEGDQVGGGGGGVGA